MKRLNRLQIVSILLGFAGAAVLIVSFSGSVIPQPAGDQGQTLAQAWLLDSCDVDEAATFENQLRADSAKFEPVFIQAFENGPDGALVTEVEQAAGKRFDRRQELLNSGVATGLSKEDLDVARSVTREQFVSQAKNDFVLRYKSQALLGLGIVDGPKALEILQRTARDAKSPLKATAEHALLKLRQGKGEDRPR